MNKTKYIISDEIRIIQLRDKIKELEEQVSSLIGDNLALQSKLIDLETKGAGKC